MATRWPAWRAVVLQPCRPSVNFSTHGDSRDEALEQTREAILGYLEAAVKEGIPVPRADTETEIMGAMRSSSRIEFWRWFAHRERKWSCRESNPGPSTPG